MQDREGFNFYRSYYETSMLLAGEDRLEFLDAIINYQFTGELIEPKNKLALLAFRGQIHSIRKQVIGYQKGIQTYPTGNPTKGKHKGRDKGSHKEVQVQVQEKEEVKEKLKYQFELFWKKYPNKIAKQKTWDKFKSLKQDEIDSILNTIDDFIAYKPFKDYVHPHPSTYLNQRRWEDVVPTRQDIKQLHNITYDVWYIAKQVPPEMERIMKLTGLTKDEFLNLYNS